jgi:hypothetical protein
MVCKINLSPTASSLGDRGLGAHIFETSAPPISLAMAQVRPLAPGHGTRGVRVQQRTLDSKLRSAGSSTKEAIARVDDVASVDDPMKAWQDMIEQFQKAALGSTAPDLLQTMFAPMQQQLDLLQKAFEAQAEFNRKLTEQAFVPMRQMLEGLQQASKTTRAAGEALKEAGDLLTQQATAMDQALSLTGSSFEMTASPSDGTA